MIICNDLIRMAMENNIETLDDVCQSSLDRDEKIKLLNSLKESMKKYCELDYNCKIYEKCNKEMDKMNSLEDFNKYKDYDDFLQHFKKKKFDVKNHGMYNRVEERIGRVVSELEESIEVIEAAPNIVCPVTKCVMTEPVTNTLCGHTYDKSSIIALLQNHKKGIKCPIGGCVKSATFTLAHLRENEKLKKYILQQQQNQDK